MDLSLSLYHCRNHYLRPQQRKAHRSMHLIRFSQGLFRRDRHWPGEQSKVYTTSNVVNISNWSLTRQTDDTVTIASLLFAESV